MTSRVETLRTPSLRLVRNGALSVFLTLLAAACGGVDKYPQTSLVPKSDMAIEVDQLQMLSVYLAAGVGLAVFGVLLYILLRFRHKPGDPVPRQVHGNARLEMAWTLIPAILLAIIAVPTVRTIFSTQQPAPPGALEIEVIGHQWWWEFRYPLPNGDTVTTANEIHVQVGRPVHLRLTSNDVIHSFWIPQMGGKRDVIPNRINHIVFTPLEAGVYLGQCAEFCGTSHALMKMRLIASEPDQFAAWLANEAAPAVEPTDSAVLIGKQLVTAGPCVACHTIRGTDAKFGVTGPDLTHVAHRSTIAAGVLENNAANLTRWISDPQAVKPDALMPNLGIPPDQLRYIVAYLQTLY